MVVKNAARTVQVIVMVIVIGNEGKCLSRAPCWPLFTGAPLGVILSKNNCFILF